MKIVSNLESLEGIAKGDDVVYSSDLILAAKIGAARHLNMITPSGQSAAKIAAAGIESLIAERNHPAIASYLNRFANSELGHFEESEGDNGDSYDETLIPNPDNILLNNIFNEDSNAIFEDEDDAATDDEDYESDIVFEDEDDAATDKD